MAHVLRQHRLWAAWFFMLLCALSGRRVLPKDYTIEEDVLEKRPGQWNVDIVKNGCIVLQHYGGPSKMRWLIDAGPVWEAWRWHV